MSHAVLESVYETPYDQSDLSIKQHCSININIPRLCRHIPSHLPPQTTSHIKYCLVSCCFFPVVFHFLAFLLTLEIDTFNIHPECILKINSISHYFQLIMVIIIHSELKKVQFKMHLMHSSC